MKGLLLGWGGETGYRFWSIFPQCLVVMLSLIWLTETDLKLAALWKYLIETMSIVALSSVQIDFLQWLQRSDNFIETRVKWEAMWHAHFIISDKTWTLTLSIMILLPLYLHLFFSPQDLHFNIPKIISFLAEFPPVKYCELVSSTPISLPYSFSYWCYFCC